MEIYDEEDVMIKDNLENAEEEELVLDEQQKTMEMNDESPDDTDSKVVDDPHELDKLNFNQMNIQMKMIIN